MSETMKTLSVKERRIVTILVAMVMAASAAILLSPTSDAEGDDIKGEITLYGYNVVMGLQNPSQVDSVEWDFGDGSETVTVKITADNANGEVKHLYEQEGTYTVTATLRNTYTDETGQHEGVTVMKYIYHIMGFPTITFDSQGGSDVSSIEGTKSTFVASEPSAPTKDGFTFDGWYLDEDCTQAYDWSTTVVRDITLYAKWTEAVVEYTVTFDLGGAEGSIDSQIVRSGGVINEPANPGRTGFVFMGWQFDGKLWNFTSPVTSDMTLVAMWEPVGSETKYHVVTFDADGGKAGYTQLNVIEGNSVILPEATKDGFTFDGWYSGDVRIGVAGDSYKVEGNVTLTAHWTSVSEDDSDVLSYIWIVFAILAAVCLIGLVASGYALLVIPTALFAILSVVTYLLF